MTTLSFFSYISFICSPETVIYLCVIMSISSLIYYTYERDIKFSGIFDRERFSVFPKILQAILVIVTSTFLAAATVTVLKHTFKIARPEYMRIVETGYSFPSGHTTLYFAFCTALVWSLYTFKNKRNSWILFLFPILISYSRLYLQVHRPVDVIVGAVLGILCTIVVIHLYKWYVRKK